MNSVSGISGVSGNLGDIKLASTRSSGGGSSRNSSGCDAGLGLIALAAVALLVFINSCKRVRK